MTLISRALGKFGIFTNMKKLFAIFLMVTYMASAIELSYSLHYCGGHFKHVAFSSDTEKGCCGKNGHKRNCCKDKVVKAKLKSDQSATAKAMIAKVILAVFTPKYCLAPTKTVSSSNNTLAVACDSSPPFVRSIPIYLQNRVLRI